MQEGVFGATARRPAAPQQTGMEPSGFAAAIVEAIDNRRKKPKEEEVKFNIQAGLHEVKLDNLQVLLCTCTCCVWVASSCANRRKRYRN